MAESKHYQFVQNRQCEYFPCHPGVAEEDFNCLFCFCPLYALGRKCGGACTYDQNGVKDCSRCAFPHRRQNYEAITERYRDILALVRESDKTL